MRRQYYVLFEALGPMIEVSGYVVTAGALYYGLVNWRYAELMFLLSIVYGTLISLAAMALEEISHRRYRRVRDLLLLIGLVSSRTSASASSPRGGA